MSFRLRSLYTSIPGGMRGRGGAGQLPISPSLRIPRYRTLPRTPIPGPYSGPSSPRGLPSARQRLPSLSGSGGQTAISQATPAALPQFPRSSAHRRPPTVPVALHWAQGSPGAQRPLHRGRTARPGGCSPPSCEPRTFARRSQALHNLTSHEVPPVSQVRKQAPQAPHP